MVTRREALRFSGTALCGVAGGCLYARDDSEERANRSGGSSTARSPGKTQQSEASPDDTRLEERLRFSANVIRKSSSDSPVRIAAELVNTGSETVQIGTGPTLLFSDHGPNDDLKRADDIVIDPGSYIGPWGEPYRTEAGCWRFPEDGSMLVQSSWERRELDPDDPFRETYEVLTRGDASPCLPEGVYRYQDRISGPPESHEYTLTLVLEIDSSGKLTTRTRGPTH